MKEIDKTEGAKWLLEFFSLRDQAGPIIAGVAKADVSGSQEDKIAAYSEALEKLPVILKSMRQAVSPRMTELRKIKMLQQSAMDAYIKSCEWGMQSQTDPSRVRYSAQTFFISQANFHWDLAGEEIDSFFER